MNPNFRRYLTDRQRQCQQAMETLLATPEDEDNIPPSDLLAMACKYSLQNGGKRIRAVLCYAAADALDSTAGSSVDHLACAMELLHTYSLVHDDLPAMDDDDLRRGKPSLHRAYDEATAILVGDGLQAKAYELLADAPDTNAEQKLAMIRVLASASGLQGMVKGQFIDIQAIDTELSLTELQNMDALKTGALIRASLALASIAKHASKKQTGALDRYGERIGLAFQIVDDILDVESDTATLGKTQGKDVDNNKPTYVKLMGLDGAKLEAKRLLSEALEALEIFGDSANNLRDLAHYIIDRKN